MFLSRLRFAIVWAVLVFVLLLMPANVVARYGFFADLPVDKLVHAFLFCVFFVLLVKGLRSQTSYPALQQSAMLVGFLVAVMYGVFTEVMQEVTDLGRRGDLADMVANTIGVILGMAYLRWGEARLIHHNKALERYF